MPDMRDEEDLRSAGRAFAAAAFEVLGDLHVIPPPVYHPYVAAGRDYEGTSVMGLREYGVLESVLEATYPGRFASPVERGHGQYASSYILSFLEASVARCAALGDFDAMSGAVGKSLDQLMAILGTPSCEVVCCRHVCHLTTESAGEVRIGDVIVLPEPEGFGGLNARIQEEIPGAATAWNREDPRPYDPPHSLLIIRETTDEPRHYMVRDQLSHRLDHFLLVARLITAGTVRQTYEVSGASTLVSDMNPVMRTFSRRAPRQVVRRTVRLSGDDGPAFAALSKLIDSAEVPGQGMVTTSFGIAFSKFSGADSGVWFEDLVDLATALEAILIGDDKETEGLTLRLRGRAAALLATGEDSARNVFNDVGALYNLRSKLVHGGQLKLTDLRKIIAKVSTVPPGTAQDAFGVALGHAIDRIRDLVRRAILARLCLAERPAPLWPFTGQTSVDAILADDAQRGAWRSLWHDRLDQLGVSHAAERPRSAVDFLSPEDL